MKAMILAAGRGERMRPLTNHTPKSLLKIAEKPLIQYHIEKLVLSGISDIVINVAHLGEKIIKFVGDGSQFDAIVTFSKEPNGLETGGGILNAMPLLCPNNTDDAFVCVNADVWTDYDFANLPKKISGLAHLILVENPEHNPSGDFGLTKNSSLVLNQSEHQLTFSGISVISPKLLSLKPNPPKSFPIAPLFRTACDQQRVTGNFFSGQWFDIGTPERLAFLNEQLIRKTLND